MSKKVTATADAGPALAALQAIPEALLKTLTPAQLEAYLKVSTSAPVAAPAVVKVDAQPVAFSYPFTVKGTISRTTKGGMGFFKPNPKNGTPNGYFPAAAEDDGW